MRPRIQILLVLASLGWPVAAAQDFPARQVRIVVPQAPGGVTGVIARALAQRLAETAH